MFLGYDYNQPAEDLEMSIEKCLERGAELSETSRGCKNFPTNGISDLHKNFCEMASEVACLQKSETIQCSDGVKAAKKGTEKCKDGSDIFKVSIK